MVRNDEFYSALRAFFEVVLAALRVDAGIRDDEPDVVVEHAQFLPNGGVQQSWKARRLFPARQLSDRGGEMRRLPNFCRLQNVVAGGPLADELLVDHDGSRVDDAESNYRLYQFTCFPLLSRYASGSADLGFDEERFDELYAEVIAYCSLPTVRLRGIAPIFNFDLEDGGGVITPLDTNLLIRRLSSAEKSQLGAGAADSSLWSRSDLYSIDWTAEITEDIDKKTPAFDPRADIEILESNLRLLHPDPRHPPTIKFVSVTPEPRFNPIFMLGGRRSWPVARVADEFPSAATRKLSVSDMNQLRQRWQQRDLLKDRRLRLALRHFSGVFDRARPEEQLLDLWIALETLYLPDGWPAGKLQRRGSSRIATYLASEPNRQIIVSQIENSYTQRSYIVHGGDIEHPRRGLNDDLPTVVQTTLGYLRVTLEKILDSGIMPDLTAIDRSFPASQP